MPNTRSSARLSAQGSSPSKSKENTTSQSTQAGTKRKATHQTSPASKRGKKSAPKKEKNQKTLEETAVLNGQEVKDETDQDDQSNDVEMKEVTTENEAETKEARKLSLNPVHEASLVQFNLGVCPKVNKNQSTLTQPFREI